MSSKFDNKPGFITDSRGDAIFDGNYNKLYGPYVQPFSGQDTTDIQPDTQNLQFWFLGSKNAYYEYIGTMDGLEGVGPHVVQLGDEQYQSDYNVGWSNGNYFRTYTGTNQISL